jgi:hypothetical protein
MHRNHARVRLQELRQLPHVIWSDDHLPDHGTLVMTMRIRMIRVLGGNRAGPGNAPPPHPGATPVTQPAAIHRAMCCPSSFTVHGQVIRVLAVVTLVMIMITLMILLLPSEIMSLLLFIPFLLRALPDSGQPHLVRVVAVCAHAWREGSQAAEREPAVPGRAHRARRLLHRYDLARNKESEMRETTKRAGPREGSKERTEGEKVRATVESPTGAKMGIISPGLAREGLALCRTTSAPPSRSEWPPMYLVTECSTKSMPIQTKGRDQYIAPSECLYGLEAGSDAHCSRHIKSRKMSLSSLMSLVTRRVRAPRSAGRMAQGVDQVASVRVKVI